MYQLTKASRKFFWSTVSCLSSPAAWETAGSEPNQRQPYDCRCHITTFRQVVSQNTDMPAFWILGEGVPQISNSSVIFSHTDHSRLLSHEVRNDPFREQN
jgi:hypothetical protein